MKKNAKLAPPKNVDEYIDAQPVEVRELLHKLRQLIKKTAPKAEELISYGIAGYKYNGMLLYFGAFKGHYSLFGVRARIFELFKSELSKFDVVNRTIHFSYAKPLPATLIKKIIKERVKENELSKKTVKKK